MSTTMTKRDLMFREKERVAADLDAILCVDPGLGDSDEAEGCRTPDKHRSHQGGRQQIS